MGLRRYSSMRDFSKTSEPRGNEARRGGRAFVVQKHAASRLHYDLRLEMGGVLKSWAVPKGPSLNPADKRLAVEVEDHPVDYGGFEGTIPKGQYGGGTVMLWDIGRWTPLDANPARALSKGKLSFLLEGDRLRGGWTLTRMAARGDKPNWLLIKRDDEHASRKWKGWGADFDRSVRSKRTMTEIAAGNGAGAPRRRRTDPDAPIPGALTPQLCTLADHAPAGDGWLHETKFDGYRLLALKVGEEVRLMTRGGKDWTDRFPPIVDSMRRLKIDRALIDGEAVIVEPSGKTSFQRLQQGIKAGSFDDLLFIVFDALRVGDNDLTRLPLLERKEALRRLVKDGVGVIRYSEHVRGHGPRLLKQACGQGLEGIISKRVDAVYAQGRSKTWLKVKCSKRQEFVIVGWTAPSGSRSRFGALLLAAHDDAGRLVYTGRVGTGFNEATLKDIGDRLKALARKSSPLHRAPSAEERRGAHWVEPRLVAEIEFTEWTEDGRLRHPSFQGLREDKEAGEVRIEGVGAAPAPASKRRPDRRAAGPEPVVIAGVAISSPERVVYESAGLTKADIARYYERAAERILPHIADRPLSTVRCPQGRGGQCFFQKHLGDSFGEHVLAIDVTEKSGPTKYIGVDSAAGLISLVQFGVLEIHPWGAKAGDLERPDTMTFDLDPGDGVGFDRVREGAARVRAILEELDLVSFVKTSGGKGLHVVAPLTPSAGWDEVKSFAAGVALRLAREEPERYLAKMTKSARAGRIFVDYLRNGRGATSVAPYSTRAREGAPVSMPLRWAESSGVESGAQFSVTNTPARLRGRDPWEGYFKVRQKLTASRLRAVSA